MSVREKRDRIISGHRKHAEERQAGRTVSSGGKPDDRTVSGFFIFSFPELIFQFQFLPDNRRLYDRNT
jgi:hypothetical protein